MRGGDRKLAQSAAARGGKDAGQIQLKLGARRIDVDGKCAGRLTVDLDAVNNDRSKQRRVNFSELDFQTLQPRFAPNPKAHRAGNDRGRKKNYADDCDEQAQNEK